jgi:hypothetical protein
MMAVVHLRPSLEGVKHELRTKHPYHRRHRQKRGHPLVQRMQSRQAGGGFCQTGQPLALRGLPGAEPPFAEGALMRLVCPACGSVNSLDSLLGHEGARAAMAELAAISGPLAGALIRYLALFRPATRQLMPDRFASLLAELKPMILAARIERSGRSYAAPREVWVAAIDSILASRDRLTLPLKSHGYLLEIIVGASAKAEATAEAKREAGRAGITPVGGLSQPKPETAPEPAPRASRETIAKTLAEAKAITRGNAQ